MKKIKNIVSAKEKSKKNNTNKFIIKYFLIMIFSIFYVLIISRNFFIKFENTKVENSDNSNSENNNKEETESEKPTESDKVEEIKPSTETDKSSVKKPSTSLTIKNIGTKKTGYEPLDSSVASILSKITSKSASAKSRLNAIYNYVKNNMKYDMNAPGVSGLYDKLKAKGYSTYDAQQMTLAYNAIKYKRGVCDNYAALILVLARASGIEVWQYGGLSARGTSHAWNIVFINNKKYLVDANYGIFLKPFSSSGYKEQQNGKNYFNYFRITPPKEEEKKISWMFNAGYSSQKFLGNTNGKVTKTAKINRPLYSSAGATYTNPITPFVNLEGKNNSFSATVSAGGTVIETLKSQSGSNQYYYFTWYPKEAGSYVIDIIAKSDNVFEGHFIIYANLTN